MGALSDFAKKVRESRAAGGGNFIKDGSYRLTILALKQDKGFSGEKFVAELLVETAEAFAEVENEKGEAVHVAPNSIGSQVSFVQLFEKYPQTAFGNVKAFLLALTGDNEDEINDTDFDAFYSAALGPDQPMRGASIACSTFRKWTKDRKTLMTLPKWAAIEQTPEQIVARRAILDASPTTANAPQPTAAA